MDQTPIFENSLVSEVIVNDDNFVSANEMDLDEQQVFDLITNNVQNDCPETCCTCFDKEEMVTFSHGEEFKDVTIHNVRLNCEGRILKIKLNLRDVCRGRKIRLAVLFYEKQQRKKKELRGLRTCEFAVPGKPVGCLEELRVGDFCFILPEEHLCNRKAVVIKVVAHYASFPSEKHNE